MTHLPQGWEVKTIENVCKNSNSNLALKDIKDKSGDYPVFGASGIVGYVDFFHKAQECLGIIKDGAGVGRVFVLPKQSSVIGTLSYLENNETTNLKYLFYFLKNLDFSKYILGSAIPHIYFRDYKKEQIPLPPLKEQGRIAGILDLAFEKIDTSTELLKANLANLDELAKSVLDRAFNPLGDSADSTESTQNPNTHDAQSPYPLPQHWEWKSLGEIASVIQSGFAINKSNEIADGYIHLRTHNIATDGNLNFETLVKVKKELIKEQQSFIEEGDILFNNTNSTELVGKTALVTQNYNYAFSNHITKIKLFNQYSPKLVVFYFVLLLKNKYFERICHKWIGQSGINTDKLKQIQIPLPKDIKEQKQIAMHLDSVFDKIQKLKELYNAQLQDYEELKQSLLTQAFSGKL
ncbi:restriction endonuclease subunit S [Helicobacter equorum]|uniref:Type I restriction endonuclease n=1 Tax=Helicobacter equorum TaxID=361872 RepID=A0A3D8IV35_9HELI|nr:restriction endonuclease subunit S [Helicobacter equorum]RDU68504.1 type I restriction endonuclease [Helicobacter equorum]